ncbi:hypothetical protein AC1031_022010 [Aphanomyces cochlioides]|nr:hypothetical protein AC1031_022010 [Aphanomyces cochlioides]
MLTITFDKTTSATHHATKVYIRQRVNGYCTSHHARIYIQNLPTSSSQKTICAKYPPKVIVEEAHLPELSPQLDYAKVLDACIPYEVLTGTALINSDHPAFRVTWINISDSLGALFFSLAHGSADGYTHYRLYGMLTATTPIEALTPTRFKNFPKGMNAAVKGGNDAIPLFSSMPYVFNMISTMIVSPSPQFTMHTFNPEWISIHVEKHFSHRDVMDYAVRASRAARMEYGRTSSCRNR